uniref:U22-Lycotoxin-Lsp1i_1 n=1 Tax=Lycosa sp. SGP-2016 TaxID=1905177 RepID=A0A482ZEB4_9ARAC
MKYTIISFLLLVALTCTTARSIDAAEENAQEVREETSNEDALFSLFANEDEEARSAWIRIYEKLKKKATTNGLEGKKSFLQMRMKKLGANGRIFLQN